MEVMRATEEWQRAGAYYVRIQAMAKKHHIGLRQEFDDHDGDTFRCIRMEKGLVRAIVFSSPKRKGIE